MNLTELRHKSLSELSQMASEMGLGNQQGSSRQELTLNILRCCAGQKQTLYGDGFLEILPDGFGFLRSVACAYQPGPDDIYVSPSQIRLFSLRKGEYVFGEIRPPREAERYFALLKVTKICDSPAEQGRCLPLFEKLTPIYPNLPIQISLESSSPNVKALTLMQPLAFGQRCLISGPPGSGKSTLLRELAATIAREHPKARLIMLFIDQSPEDLRAREEQFAGLENVELVGSCFDDSPQRHVMACEMLLEKARRMTERQEHTLIFLDSLTSLIRACNALPPSEPRMSPGGLEPVAMLRGKRFFAAARNLKEGGSLTIVATANSPEPDHVDNSKLDNAIFDELHNLPNMRIRLNKELAAAGLFPAVDLTRVESTRQDMLDKLVSGAELEKIRHLRQAVKGRTPKEALDLVLHHENYCTK